MDTPPLGETALKLGQLETASLRVGNECDSMDVFAGAKGVSVQVALTKSNMVYV